MYLHIRIRVTHPDDRLEVDLHDQIIPDPPETVGWDTFPLGYFVAQDVLTKTRPLHEWQITYAGDPFKGLTAVHVHDPSHPNCAKRVEVQAWLDELPEQGALLPEQTRFWESQLGFLDSV